MVGGGGDEDEDEWKMRMTFEFIRDAKPLLKLNQLPATTNLVSFKLFHLPCALFKWVFQLILFMLLYHVVKRGITAIVGGFLRGTY